MPVLSESHEPTSFMLLIQKGSGMSKKFDPAGPATLACHVPQVHFIPQWNPGPPVPCMTKQGQEAWSTFQAPGSVLLTCKNRWQCLKAGAAGATLADSSCLKVKAFVSKIDQIQIIIGIPVLRSMLIFVVRHFETRGEKETVTLEHGTSAHPPLQPGFFAMTSATA